VSSFVEFAEILPREERSLNIAYAQQAEQCCQDPCGAEIEEADTGKTVPGARGIVETTAPESFSVETRLPALNRIQSQRFGAICDFITAIPR
jgi:hypothetical protein